MDPNAFPATPKQNSLLLICVTHLQIIQETLEVKSSLLCIPVAVGPNVFKTGSRKHSIMVLCEAKGQVLNAFQTQGGRVRRNTGELWALRLSVHWVS